MNDLTKKFGLAGEIGSKGEIWFYNHLINTYDSVYDYRKDMMWQMFGVDFAITRNNWSRFFLLDVKTNLKDDGTFFLELDNGKNNKLNIGWLFTSKSDRIVHINLNKEEFIWYDLPAMRHEILMGDNDYKKCLTNNKDGLIMNINMFTQKSKLIKTIHNVRHN